MKRLPGRPAPDPSPLYERRARKRRAREKRRQRAAPGWPRSAIVGVSAKDVLGFR